MTQPSTSESSAQSAATCAKIAAQDTTASGVSKALLLPQSPAIRHPNFDPAKTPINPARPMTDIPDPAPSYNNQLRRLNRQASSRHPQARTTLAATQSKWALIESEALADHLALLTAGRLIELPASFYTNHSEQPLLPPLTDMTLLDMTDINAALQAMPNLNRYGIAVSTGIEEDSSTQHVYHNAAQSAALQNNLDQRYHYDADELLNSVYADDWEVILHPERFDSGVGSLGTDVLPCSVAVHALGACETRKTINTRYSAADICHYLRSYLLSQLRLSPAHRQQYRQIRLFAGHVIVAAHHLGWDIQIGEDGACYFNVSSRCGLLSRYPNLNEYHVNGWSG